MLKFETITETDHTCDTCHSAESTVYCRADSAYLCNACDIHIHSANPLARRHHRIPISQASYAPSAAEINGFLFGPDEEEEEDNNNATSFCENVDEYLDLNDYNSSCQTQNYTLLDNEHKHYGTNDSVVPIEYDGFSTEYKYNNHSSLSQTISFNNEVSISSMDVGVVPESNVQRGTVDLFSGPAVEIATQLTPLEREARVMRYREKKKMRKFEKTIRYASRKAYAETRPRIKGRFAKRTTELDGEVEQMFASSMLAENAYGVVPTFKVAG